MSLWEHKIKIQKKKKPNASWACLDKEPDLFRPLNNWVYSNHILRHDCKQNKL